MRHLFALFAIVFGMLAAASGCADLQLRLTPAESAGVIILRASATDDDEVARSLKCNGVAIGPHSVLTAAHCTTAVGAPVAFVTSDLWFATAKAFRVGVVTYRDTASDLSVITSATPLTQWVPPRAPTSADSIVTVVTGFRAERGLASPTIGRLARPVRQGESGSAVLGVDGDVIGVIITCDAVNGECDPSGGSSYAPVNATVAAQ